MCTGLELPLILGAAGAIGGGIGADKQNQAAAEAASAEGNQILRRGVDQHTARVEQAQQALGLARVQGGESESLNFGERIAQAAGDAGRDVAIGDRETVAQMDALKARLKANSQDVGFAALEGGLQGFSAGMSLNSLGGVETKFFQGNQFGKG